MADESRYQHYTKLEPGGSMLEPDVQYDSERMVVLINGHPGEAELTPYQSLNLLAWLQDRKEMLTELRDNYQHCDECGGSHHKEVKVCPVIYNDDLPEGW